jgi:hypothetical protein
VENLHQVKRLKRRVPRQGVKGEEKGTKGRSSVPAVLAPFPAETKRMEEGDGDGRVAGRRARGGGQAEADGRRRLARSPGGGRGRREQSRRRFDPRVTAGQQGKDPLDPYSSRVDPLRTVGRI